MITNNLKDTINRNLIRRYNIKFTLYAKYFSIII